MINKVVAFGCSFVMGDGMGEQWRGVSYHEKPLAIYYLGKELGLGRDKCVIMAGGGTSNQSFHRNFYNYITDVENQKSLDETLFVFGWTEKSRWEFYSDVEKTWIPITVDRLIPGPWPNWSKIVLNLLSVLPNKMYEKLVKEYYKVSFNLKKHFEKSIREIISVQNTCKVKKLQYIMFDSIESVFQERPKNKLVKLLDKKYWINWDGNYSDWVTMNIKNLKEYTAYGNTEDHPSALSQKVWGDYLISMVKSLYNNKEK
jgi:hypothetical protein